MYILRLSCDDQPGIVAAVASCLRDNQCNIEDSSQFHDIYSNGFYMRVVFSALEETALEKFQDCFKDIADNFSMNWRVCNTDEKLKALIMVSQHDHCLYDLLYRYRTGQLPINITGVVSNHETTREMVESHGLDFHHLPISKDTKKQQEDSLREIISETETELIVLARYMQILSKEFCQDYAQRIINIHHSFLPGFKGAKPYHQAYERGVKIIGATAHFVTQDLDEGPIIAQDIAHVDHSDTPDKMVAQGRDIESRVLARAVKQYAERRIFLNGKRTIIL